MSYYVPLGFRGLILRIGAVLTGLFGSMAYWFQARRRARRVAPNAPHRSPGVPRPRVLG